ncbi:A24 family peptidase [Gryllotalpicola daejeonensis]|uniref:Prepilin leader peptidase/N-methyltransferase n=1 Tax=Gryllotalpicola daejeonensis TaxID=993087 RepID=A0ABP7ZJL7_9MICO
MAPTLAPLWFYADVIALLGVFGLLIGSFLNVVVYRVPAGLSIVWPPSACPTCGEQIKPYDNIPVISWLVLRGKCRNCATPISPRYLFVELGTGVFFALVAWRFWPFASDVTDASQLASRILTLLAFLYLAAISVVLALIDLDTHKLPNAIVLPSYLVGAVLLAASALSSHDLGRLLTAAIGAAAAFALFFLLAFAVPGGMGFGDVKLAGVLGLFLGFLGWGQLVVGIFGGFLLGGLFAIGLLIARRAGRRSGIPFGPWMLAGAWLGVAAGGPLIDSYLTLTGLAG